MSYNVVNPCPTPRWRQMTQAYYVISELLCKQTVVLNAFSVAFWLIVSCSEGLIYIFIYHKIIIYNIQCIIMIYYTYYTHIIYYIYYMVFYIYIFKCYIYHKIPEVNPMDVNIWKNKSAQILWTVSFHSKRSSMLYWIMKRNWGLPTCTELQRFLGAILSVKYINNDNGCHSCAHYLMISWNSSGKFSQWLNGWGKIRTILKIRQNNYGFQHDLIWT